MTGQADRTVSSRLRILLWIIAGSLLLAPAIAMQFTEKVRWDAADFLAASGLIAVTGLALDLLTRRGGSRAFKFGATIAVLSIAFLVWINAAVGIIGREGDWAGWAFVAFAALMISSAVFVFRPRSQ